MRTVDEQQPWVKLEKLVDESDAEQLEAFLEGLPAGEPARALSHLEAYCKEEVPYARVIQWRSRALV